MFQLAYFKFVVYLSFIICITVVHPSAEVTYVCPGGILNLTCGVPENKTSVRWNVTFSQYPERIETRSVTIYDVQPHEIEVGPYSIYLSIPQASNSSSQPVSMLISENVTVDLNETVISCNLEEMTTVHVIGVNGKYF